MSTVAEQLQTQPILPQEPRALLLGTNPSWFTATRRFIQQKPLGAFGAFLVIVFVFTALFGRRLGELHHLSLCGNSAPPS